MPFLGMVVDFYNYAAISTNRWTLLSFIKSSKAKFRRRTSHEPNRMQMRENKGFFLISFDSAHVKYGVWTWPKTLQTQFMPHPNKFPWYEKFLWWKQMIYHCYCSKTKKAISTSFLNYLLCIMTNSCGCVSIFSFLLYLDWGPDILPLSMIESSLFTLNH